MEVIQRCVLRAAATEVYQTRQQSRKVTRTRRKDSKKSWGVTRRKICSLTELTRWCRGTGVLRDRGGVKDSGRWTPGIRAHPHRADGGLELWTLERRTSIQTRSVHHLFHHTVTSMALPDRPCRMAEECNDTLLRKDRNLQDAGSILGPVCS
jgi:hypothetical protein